MIKIIRNTVKKIKIHKILQIILLNTWFCISSFRLFKSNKTSSVSSINDMTRIVCYKIYTYFITKVSFFLFFKTIIFFINYFFSIASEYYNNTSLYSSMNKKKLGF